MTYAPLNTIQAFLPPNIDLPKPNEDPEVFYQVINDRERQTGTVVNTKETAIYSTLEIPTAQQWPGATPQEQKSGFRKVVNFPAPLAAGANNQAHGLGALAAFTFTDIHGTVQNAATPLFAPLPQGGPNDAMIEIGAANVTVTVPAAYSGAGWSAQVVLEYLKN